MDHTFDKIKSVFFDFDGVFTDNCVIVDQYGNESVKCWRSDGIGLERLKSIGVNLLIISTETNPVVSRRASKLKLECIQGVVNKRDAIINYVNINHLELSETAYLGNDINDIGAFNIVGFPIAPADAYEEIFPHVTSILNKRGGYGAVRELCDLIYFDKLLTAIPKV